MSRPYAHIVNQGPVIATLGKTAMAALRQRFAKRSSTAPAVPGPVYHGVLPPRPETLVMDYVRHVGGNPYAYLDILPPHLWPQWGFPFAAKTLEGINYPLMRVLNGGCRLEVRRPLPQRSPLVVRARLVSIDDDGRRAVLHQSIVTGTDDVPDAIVAHLYAIVPLRRRQPGNQAGSSKDLSENVVPDGAIEIDRWRLARDAGLSFALLTGDFNPVHWIRPYARLFGFRSTILHGFSTMARTAESINRRILGGDTTRMKVLDVRFTRPIVLPAEVGVFVDGQRVFVAKARGQPASLIGSFEAA